MTMTITNRHPARNRICGLPNYFDSKGEAIEAISSILNDYNIGLECGNCEGVWGGRTFDLCAIECDSLVCDKCNKNIKEVEFNNCLSFSWYRIDSGRWEIVAYIT